MAYNLSEIMTRAWATFRKNGGGITFAESLHRSWQSAKSRPLNEARIQAAKEAAGVTEECKTWSDWKKAGFEVIHGSKALFGVDLIHSSKGDGATYAARFFGASQVRAIA